MKSNLKRHMTRDVMKEKHQLLKQTKVYLTSELCYNPCVKRDHNISFVTARASKRKVNRVPKPRAYSGVWGNAPPFLQESLILGARKCHSQVFPGTGFINDMVKQHSLTQTPRSFWPAPRSATPGTNTRRVKHT